MSGRRKIYARDFLVDQSLVVDETVSNVPEGAELNQQGEKFLRATIAAKWPRTISHYCLMPMHRLKKIVPDKEGLCQTDVCIFGGCIATGMYVSSSSVITSPVVLLSNGRVLTQSGSIYEVEKKVSEADILELFPELKCELRE